MSVIHLQHEGKHPGSVVLRAFGWLGAAVKMTHQAIVAAKLERIENELVLRRGYSGDEAWQHQAMRYPQRPLILSDKWDF
jgi:hypothetical protein